MGAKRAAFNCKKGLKGITNAMIHKRARNLIAGTAY